MGQADELKHVICTDRSLLFCIPVKMHHFYNNPLILFSIKYFDPSCNLGTAKNVSPFRVKEFRTCSQIMHASKKKRVPKE
uniref:Uncharacterized protein n=1 Tax=Rhizophora mucronata TaxID=61149 RepID=A0A2P2KRP0_RHIMU